MWLSAGSVLTIVGLVSANMFLEDPGVNEIGVNGFETGFNSNIDGQESPNMFSNENWSSVPSNTAFVAAETQQDPDALLAEADSPFPTPDDWAYQPDTIVLRGGCTAPTSSRTRSKRFQGACPAETEERKSICETDLYPTPLCCLGPEFGAAVIVNKCQNCRCEFEPLTGDAINGVNR